MGHDIEVIRLPGFVSYTDGLRLQYERRTAVEEGRLTEAVFLLEHMPVITLGRNAHAENILCAPEELAAMGIAQCEADRGGDVTYHGPGQLVAYPILNLNRWIPSIRWCLRLFEEIIIRQLADYGLQGERCEGFTGVWVNGAKVAAIGIGVHNWVTYHGLALNVNPELSHFARIVPCGIADKPVTSLHRLLGESPTMERVMLDFEKAFRSLLA